MPTEENDYSLPYEEYLKNFRKTHHPQAMAMSKEQYERKQAETASNKKIGLSPEAAQVYAEANAVKNGTTPEEEAAKNQAAINRDNNPDVDDTRAIGATKEDLDYMLQNGKISRAAYEKQIAALNTPEVQEEMAKGEKKADETVWDPSDRDATVADSVAEVTTPKKDDPPKVVENKNRYNKAMMSIWDAWRAGEISKETAGYFTIDAIATLAKNLGRSIGNVGAQFSGGTIDNGHDTSMWEQRRNSMFNTELQKETEGVDTFENKFKQLSYNRNSTINDLIEAVKSDAEKLSDDNPLKIAYLSLAAMIASGQVDGTTTLAATGAKGITELFNLFKGKDKK